MTWWSYLWPALAAALVVGMVTGIVAFRRTGRKRSKLLAVGLAAGIALSLLWHGPLGGAHRFAAKVESDARLTLDNYEMWKVSANLERGPLTRRLLLAGPADDFQSSELVRIMGSLSGVSSARWSDKGHGTPLILEGIGIALLVYLLGLLVAYLIELRRRYNLQWNW
jgi:hypothetical protein